MTCRFQKSIKSRGVKKKYCQTSKLISSNQNTCIFRTQTA